MATRISQLAALMALAASSLAGAAMAQTTPPAEAPAVARPGPTIARENLVRMQRPISIDLNETRLEEVVKFISDATGAQLEPIWRSDRDSNGLDRDALITLSAKNLPALAFLDKVLLASQPDARAEELATWQMTPNGTMQIAPRQRLNKFRRVELYDINDLLFILPTYDDAPEIDLQQVLQSSGSGGGQSPFEENNEGEEDDPELKKTKPERAEDLINLLTSFVEQEQWIDGGGDVPRPRYYQGHIIVDAPDYIHRGVAGYRWWPSVQVNSRSTARRYVSLSPAAGVSQLIRLQPVPVTGAVGSGGGGSPPPGGGG